MVLKSTSEGQWQTPAGFSHRSHSKDCCLVRRLGKESKSQKPFKCSNMSRFGADSLANMISIYFKLVGEMMVGTRDDKFTCLPWQYKWREFNMKKQNSWRV